MPEHDDLPEPEDREPHEQERERNPYGPLRRYDRAPAPVKVAVSLVYIQMLMLALGAAAVNLTLARTPGGETGRWPWTALIGGLAVFYALLAYRLLQGVEWARRAAIVLTVVGIALAVAWFSVWFCIAIALGLVLIAALLSQDARRFFGAAPPDDAAPG